MDDARLFEEYGGSDVLDQGMPTKCPLIYGGEKDIDQKNYICTCAYDPEGNEYKTLMMLFRDINYLIMLVMNYNLALRIFQESLVYLFAIDKSMN